MIFSTYRFIFLFFPVTFLCYALFLRAGRESAAKWTLVCASLIFYAYGAGDFFPFFVGSVLFNYGVGSSLGKVRNRSVALGRFFLLVGILGNVALLGYYKYTDFLIFNFNFLFGAELPYRHIVLPIGISFFTFQLIAYLVDSYRGETQDYDFLNYLMFITFFPQLIVGPIVHHKDVVPQYKALRQNLLNYNNMSVGLFLFAMGCAKKLLLADPLSGWAQRGFDDVQILDMTGAWAASLSYTLSYYFDLSGYADMALGLGAMLGIRIPINFNSPFKARNFADYWRRWHITLSRFLNDYVFRSVYDRRKGSGNFYFAIFLTFVVSGFWHGAGWTFVIWGILNGIFVIFSHMMRRAGKQLPFLMAWALTFLGVVLARIFFVSSSLSDAWSVVMKLFDLRSFDWTFDGFVAVRQPAYIGVGLLITWFLPNSIKLKEEFAPNGRYLAFAVSLAVLSLLSMDSVGDFLYFQF